MKVSSDAECEGGSDVIGGDKSKKVTSIDGGMRKDHGVLPNIKRKSYSTNTRKVKGAWDEEEVGMYGKSRSVLLVVVRICCDDFDRSLRTGFPP